MKTQSILALAFTAAVALTLAAGCKDKPAAEATAEKTNSVAAGAQQITTTAGKAIDKTKEVVKTAGEKVSDGVETAVDKTKEAVKTGTEKTTDALKKGAEKTGEAFEKIGDKLKEIGK